jgi:branched-chain amino acid transport system permease protein
MSTVSLQDRRWAWRRRNFPQRGAGVSLFELGLLAVCVLVALVGLPPSYQDIAVLTFLWGGLALAWNIAGGYAGLISFGHAAFFGVGAYTSTILFVGMGVSPWIGIWCSGLVSAAFGALLALICARLRGPFFILSTLAAAEVVRISALNWATLTGGPEGLSIPPVPALSSMVFSGKTAYVLMMLGFMVSVYALTKWLEGSRYGFYLFAVRDDAEAADAAGVNPLAVKTAAMALSAGLTGIGGSLFAQYFLYLDPTFMISPELSFQFALLAAVGGLSTAVGPVLGSVLLTPMSELLRSYLGNQVAGLHLAIYSGLLIVVVLYVPGGIAGALTRLSKWKEMR